MISVASIALLPICTVIGDYQWITFTVMNIAFYAITTIEVDRYLYFIENNNRMYEVFALKKKQRDESIERKIIYDDLTRREIEVALSILSDLSYKDIAKDLFIAESTVSKHASNIFKKTGAKNRSEFLKRFRKKKWKSLNPSSALFTTYTKSSVEKYGIFRKYLRKVFLVLFHFKAILRRVP